MHYFVKKGEGKFDIRFSYGAEDSSILMTKNTIEEAAAWVSYLNGGEKPSELNLANKSYKQLIEEIARAQKLIEELVVEANAGGKYIEAMPGAENGGEEIPMSEALTGEPSESFNRRLARKAVTIPNANSEFRAELLKQLQQMVFTMTTMEFISCVWPYAEWATKKTLDRELNKCKGGVQQFYDLLEEEPRVDLLTFAIRNQK